MGGVENEDIRITGKAGPDHQLVGETQSELGSQQWGAETSVPADQAVTQKTRCVSLRLYSGNKKASFTGLS